MRRVVSTVLALLLCPMFCQALSGEAMAMEPAPEPAATDADQLPSPIVTDNSVELCLNSRYSQHSLRGAASTQQLSNIVWAAGRAPVTGARRDTYVATPTATYLYDPVGHSLSWHSDDARDDGAFAIIYESQLHFDTGVSFMPALLASVSLCRSTESSMASCPKGLGYPKVRLFFGAQPANALTTELAAHCSVPEGEPGWLPDPSTTGDNSLEEVLANLNYISSFAQTNLTLQQISQILWAGYGCTDHRPSGKAGLTVPSAWANYYLTRSIYLVNENGVYRYHNRNPSTNLTTRDHRIEQLDPPDVRRRLQSADDGIGPQSAGLRDGLRAAVGGLPLAPCYVILCLDSSYVGQEYAHLEAGFVASNMLIQATAIDLGCHFTSELSSGEQRSIQAATNIPASHVPQAVVSIGPIGPAAEVPVSVSVVLQGDGRPDDGWAVPLTVKFFATGADVLHDTPTHEFDLTTTKSATENAAICEITGVTPGTYDVTAVGQSTLTNARRSVVISAPQTSLDLGTLLEGNASRDDIVDLDDYAILSARWLTSKAQAEYDVGTDFDRDGFVDAADLCLLAANWLRGSPLEIPP
ncbi:MAG: nitroreductase family protein [Phycisphaerales bacterium]|nr:MAG: nitroreductase family protein [Phycisphaerales bacterium]